METELLAESIRDITISPEQMDGNIVPGMYYYV
jgi:hypothetical protein